MAQLYSPVEQNGLIDEVLRICGTTSAVYSNKSIISRVNNALDKYWALASDSAPKGTFDDTNNASAPIETQSLVDGTNAYKIGSFTNEVLQILKVSVLEDDGLTERDLIREEFDDYNEFLEWYSTTDKGQPDCWTKYGDFIYIRPTPDYSETNGLRAYVNRELSKFSWVSFTTTNGTDLFNATNHGLVAGDALIFETDGTIPAGITADTVVYYVIADGLATSAFKVSTTISGSTINLTSDGTGNHKYTKVSKEAGIPVIHHDYLARQASLPFLVEKKMPQTGSISQLITKDEQMIAKYWQNRDRDLHTRFTFSDRSYK